MKREPFIAAREKRWAELEQLIGQLRARLPAGKQPQNVAALPRAYRQVCQDLALVRRRMYGRALATRLNRIALQGREQLYQTPTRWTRSVAHFVARDFPRRLRGEAKLFWISTAAFLLPFAAVWVLAAQRPDLLYAIMDPASLQQYEEMYDPNTGGVDELRTPQSDVVMFAFYIRNNVGIDFKIFAGGLPFGLGTLFFLAYNGVHFGAIVGHFVTIGYDQTLFPFVVGHSSFELVAMLISGVAGLRLGAVLIAPGRRSRRRALIEIGPHCLQLVLGAGAMTTLAAFIEGFWSAQPLPASVKYAVGAVLWVLVIVYLGFAGRRRES